MLSVLGFLLGGALALRREKGLSREFGTQRTVQEELFFEGQLLDHFDYSSSYTWRQRYFVNSEHFDPRTGAVLLYICGEYTCPGVPSARQWANQLANLTKSLVLVLEHRFYGKSIPTSLYTNDLRFLTKEQALADLAYFIEQVKARNLHNVTNNPWVTIGGSYPGALSAWFRYKYPHLTVGAIASSAVVNMIDDFWQFDQQIYTSAMKSGKNCADALDQLSKYVEGVITGSEEGARRMKAEFGAEQLKNGEFLFFFVDIIVEYVQYGNRTGLCQVVDHTNVSKSYAAIKKIAVDTRADPADYGSAYLSSVQYSMKAGSGARSWAWQVCTEVGWFQTPSRKHPLRSGLLNLSFWQSWCSDTFGLSQLPRTSEGNMQLGGVDLNVHNLIMTNGDEDPWIWAGLQQSHGDVKAIVIDCNDCAHCVDLYTPSPNDAAPLKRARAEELSSLQAWIKDYWRTHK